jgi:twitching motility protein PilT
MQAGQEKYGMQTFNQALATAYFNRQISLETAIQRSGLPEELQEMINRGAGLLNRPNTVVQAMKAGAPGKH